MPIMYERICNYCKHTYKGFGAKYCSQSCRTFDLKPGFKKGNVPYNKGTKGVSKPNSGSFKKGVTVGNKHPKWKNGRGKTSQGYITIWTINGRTLEHRVIMEKKLGRKLKPNEVVHHMNHIRDDNRLENLMLMSRSDHAIFHNNE